MNDTCGCCEGIARLTPMATANRPGLDALAYRIGTHASFLETMLARLSSSDYPALGRLAVRLADDPAIALLDAWATVADVLTFYQERIANEGYLRTAVERRSILELARLVGYTLRPGVAASVYLAYTLDRDPEKETVALIPRGSRAQSVPGPGELPQSFEASDDLAARYSWNNLQAQLARPPIINRATIAALGALYFEGITTNLKPDDRLLLVFGPLPDPRDLLRVKTVTPEPDKGRTKVTLQRDSAASFAQLLRNLQVQVGRYRNLALSDVADSRIAARIDTTFLQDLQGRLAGIMTPEALAALLQEVLRPLREELALVTARGYAKLIAWLNGIVADLQDALDQAGQLASLSDGSRASATLPTLSTLISTQDGPPRSALVLGALLGSLKLPPSLPPPSPRDLDRSFERLLGPGADLGPRLLTTLDRRLATTLYKAWAAADATPPAPLQSVQALRLKAAPFGATAAPKPILDARGAVVGAEEWPLAVPTAVGVRIQYDDNIPRLALLAATIDDQSSSAQVELNSSTPDVPLQPGSVDVQITFADIIGALPTSAATLTEITFVFKPGLPEQKIVVSQRTNQPSLHLSIDVDPAFEQDLAVGQRVSVTAKGRRITVELARDPQNPSARLLGTLAIAVETLRAPDPRVLALDAQYDQIVPEGWVVVERADRAAPLITRVTKVETVAISAYNISAKVTRLTLADPWLDQNDMLLSVARATTVFAQSEPLALALEPRDDDVAGDSIELDRPYDGLEPGRWLIVSGERTDIPGSSGVAASELVMLAGVTQGADQRRPGDKLHTTIEISAPLAYTYKRDTVTIWGNVVNATHGETRAEVLGSGAGSQAFQSFALRQQPLTYVAAPTPAGTQSTLEVRVNDIRWREVDSPIELGPTDHGYITRTDDASKTTVVFGNGVYGARLPSGVENVKAVYRTGIGEGGNVKAGQISQLQSRPLGVNGVINPLSASGGADREKTAQARRNTPLGVLALDRLVSVQDYEDFARTRAGIGKASARRISDGRREVVHLTIAGAADIPIERSSDLYRNLRLALARYGDPSQPVEVASRELMLLFVKANIRIDPDYLWAVVEAKARAALLDRFDFERRDLGQDVLLSEAIGAIQAVPGVVYVDVDVLGALPETITPAQLDQIAQALQPPQQSLPAPQTPAQRLAEGLQPPPQQRIVAELARYEEQSHVVGADPALPDSNLTQVAALYGLRLTDLLRLNSGLADVDLQPGQELIVRRGIRAAQLAILSPTLTDTLILKEIKA